MDQHNPYASPVAPVAVVEPVSALGERPLFRVSGIGLATFLGTLLAGGILLAMNERALGRPQRALPVLLLSLVATVAMVATASLLPEDVPSIVFSLPPLLAVVLLARQLQGAAIDARIAAGLPMRSNWLAAGIAVLTMVGVSALLALALFAYLRWTGSSLEQLLGA